MCLIRKSKYDALQSEHLIATAKLEATTKKLADLEQTVLENDQLLSEFFKTKYENKYFDIKTLEGTSFPIKCKSVAYRGGYLYFAWDDTIAKEEMAVRILLKEVKNRVSVTTKAAYNEFWKGGSK